MRGLCIATCKTCSLLPVEPRAIMPRLVEPRAIMPRLVETRAIMPRISDMCGLVGNNKKGIYVFMHVYL